MSKKWFLSSLLAFVIPLMSVAQDTVGHSGPQNVEKDFRYHDSGMSREIHTPFRAPALSGKIVASAEGGPINRVLVEWRTTGWKRRVSAQLTGANGEFDFSTHAKKMPKRVYLKISKPQFSAMYIILEFDKTAAPLVVEMTPAT